MAIDISDERRTDLRRWASKGGLPFAATNDVGQAIAHANRARFIG